MDADNPAQGVKIARRITAEIATAANHWRALGHRCATHKKDLANELMIGGKSFSFWHQADHADQAGYVGW